MIIFPIGVDGGAVLLQLTAKVFLAVNTQVREPEKTRKYLAKIVRRYMSFSTNLRIFRHELIILAKYAQIDEYV